MNEEKRTTIFQILNKANTIINRNLKQNKKDNLIPIFKLLFPIQTKVQNCNRVNDIRIYGEMKIYPNIYVNIQFRHSMGEAHVYFDVYDSINGILTFRKFLDRYDRLKPQLVHYANKELVILDYKNFFRELLYKAKLGKLKSIYAELLKCQLMEL